MIIISTLYFLDRQELPLIYTFLVAILLFTITGKIFIAYVVEDRHRIDDTLLHLTKEIVHELNLPLSTMKANSNLLKREIKSPKGLTRLGRIESAIERLERLYSELVYSIKREIETIEKEEFELKELIEERVGVLKLLNRNPFELKLEPLVMYADRIGFEKMFDNILTNAMKYSSKEKPITISLQDRELIVEDRGVGMDELELLRIHERYFQIDSTIEGEGIGLALVKSYCDEEKIELTIHSKKGVGTVVTLKI